MQRALRPFKRRVPSLREAVLDEEATAERFAETGLLVPVPRPARVRWLEVALVVDEHNSMEVWQPTLAKLARLLRKLGAFRDVRTWGLSADDGRVWIGKGAHIGRRRQRRERRNPHELVEPGGRRLVLVASDCVAPAWRSGAVAAQALDAWAHSGPLAIVQMLPPRLWPRTGLGRGRRIRLAARRAGVTNSVLRSIAKKKPRRRRWRAAQKKPPAGVLVPVFNLDEASIADWVRLMTGQGSARGWDLPLAVDGEATAAPAVAGERSAEQRVDDFRAAASPTAKRLAGFLAAAPLRLPIMRTVQRALLPESRQTHLAEVLLGGLIERSTADAVASSETADDGVPADSVDRVTYAFHDGVRERLLDYSLRHETLRVVEEVTAWLERQEGIRTGFRAALVPSATGESLGEADRPFARLTASLLRRLGGDFGDVAGRIEESLGERPAKPPPKARYAEPITSKALWNHRLDPLRQDFVGREEIFDALDRFMSENDSGYFQIIGPPGWGKTAIAAEFVRRTGCVNAFAVPGLEKEQVILHLGAELISKHGFAEQSPEAREALRDPTRFLELGLPELLRQAAGAVQRIEIVIDGIDELAEPPMTGPLAPGVFVIVTAERPIDLKGSVLDLGHFDQRAAITRYVERLDNEVLISAIPAQSDGSFLYASIAVEQDRWGLYQLWGDPPSGLDFLLEATWEYVLDKYSAAERHLFHILLESWESVSKRALPDSARILQDASRLGLVRQDAAERYFIAHPLLRSFLAEKMLPAEDAGETAGLDKLAVIVHGTWARGSDWWRSGGGFHSYLMEECGLDYLYDGAEPFTWSGRNRAKDRRDAARDFAKWITQHSPRTLEVYSHAHGASVAMLATHLGLTIDKLVMMSPIVREDYFPDWDRIGEAYNIQAKFDPVIGVARGVQWFKLENVKELELDTSGHSASHDPEVWEANSVRAFLGLDDRLTEIATQGMKLDLPPPRPSATVGSLFEAWKPVVPPWFVGRKRALRRLESALGSGDGVSIVGDGKIGKSSLLLTWQQQLRDSGRKVRLVDGQGAAGSYEAAFVAEIIGRPAPEGADPAADVLAAWAAGEPEGLAPVVLVDELDHLLGRFSPRFFERLRNLLGMIVLVVASRREVDTLYREQGRTSPFGNRLRLVRLGLLDPPAADELISRGAAILDHEDAALMRRWAGRHPFFLQLLGHALIEARELGDSRDEALDRFRDQAGVRLRELWGRLGEAEREALHSAVRGQPVRVKPLVWRGLLDADGRPFAEVLAAWLRELG